MKSVILNIILILLANTAIGQNYTLKDTGLVDDYIDKARIAYRNNPKEALDYCKQALEIAKQTKSPSHIGRSYNGLGIMSNMMGNQDTALYYFEKSFTYLKESISYLEAYGIRLNMAELYFERGKVLTAFEYMQESMHVFDSAKDDYGRVVARMNLARAYSRMGNKNISRKLYKKSIEIIDNKDTSILIQVLTNLGASYLDDELVDSAYTPIKQAEGLAMSIQQNYDLISIYLNLGDIFQIKEQFDTAKHYYHNALRINKLFGVNHHSAVASARLCRLYILTANYDSALYYGTTAQNIAEGMDDLGLLEELYYDMHNLMDTLGKKDESLNYLRKFTEIQDSIKNEKILQKVEQYKYELNLAEKEKQLEELEKDQKANNRVILYQRVFGIVVFIFLILFGLMAIMLARRSKMYKEANTELEKTNMVKNKVLATISHDLRSPLASLFSLVNLSNRNLLGEQESKNLYKILEKKLSGTMVIVDNLLYWSKNQIAEIKLQTTSVDINDLILKNIELYKNIASAKNVALIAELEEVKTIQADKTLINLVIRNLISNAIKYTKAKGKVTLSTKVNKKTLKVSIKDTGIGMPESTIQKLFTEEQFSSQGTNEETGTGLGLLISYEFIKMHDSTLKVESKISEGTCFYFELKLTD